MHDIKIKIDYENPVGMGNIATKLSDKEQNDVGSHLLNLVEADIQSRSHWVDSNDDWLKLAAQVKENKTFPWPEASNVKYPLLAVACTQFQARAMPALIKDNAPVKAGVIGEDPEMEKQARATRIAAHMSWQVTEKMDNWLDDFDRLLYVLPISGSAHRKIYYKSAIKSPASKVILPQDMIIDFNATNLKDCRRTERLTLSRNEVTSLENSEMILKVTSSPMKQSKDHKEDEEILLQEDNGIVEDLPHTFYEVHCTLDLDGDGWEEPYVATINSVDGQLLRLKPSWEAGKVERHEKTKKIINIVRIQYYADYQFMPHPLSATHSLGFGHLLGPLNQAANSVINQLIDAGTLANMQGGFLARGVKMSGGKTRLKPGQWITLNINPQDLKNGIVPLPVKEPSGVLFSLLGMLIEAGERISSVTDAMVGENPGQNTPTSNMQAMLEQGQKVFSGIFARVYRGLGREFKLLYHINRVYHDPQEEVVMLDDGTTVQAVMADYEDDQIDIRVAADPRMVTDAMEMMRAEGLMQLVSMGTVNPQFATKKYLEAQHFTKAEVQEAMTMPEQQPPIEVLELEHEKEKFKHLQMMDSVGAQLDVIRVQSEARKDVAQSLHLMAKSDQLKDETAFKKLQLLFTQMTQETNAQADNLLKMMQAEKLGQESKQIEKGNTNGQGDTGQAGNTG